jgi:hypothetical protein
MRRESPEFVICVLIAADGQCGESELQNAAMERVDRLLASVDRSAELEVARYAA